MASSTCPYCNQPGLVTTVKVHGQQGFDITGRCTECGYTYDSEYAPAEIADDLPGEFTRPMDRGAAD